MKSMEIIFLSITTVQTVFILQIKNLKIPFTEA